MAKNWYIKLDVSFLDDRGVRNMRLADQRKAMENVGGYVALMSVWAREGGMISLEDPGQHEMLKDALRPWTDKRIKEFLDLLASDGVCLIKPLEYAEFSKVCSEESLKRYGDKARAQREHNAEAGRKSGEVRRLKAEQNEQRR